MTNTYSADKLQLDKPQWVRVKFFGVSLKGTNIKPKQNSNTTELKSLKWNNLIGETFPW